MRGLNRNDRGGMTLVELLVVVCIILILAGVALLVIKGSIESTNRTEVMNTINRLYLATEEYHMTNGEYPPEDGDGYVDSNSSKNGVFDLLAQYTNVNREFLRKFGSKTVLLDPWEQPYFYDDLENSNSTTFSNSQSASDWENWGMTHPIAIYSVGTDNLNSGKNGAEDWDNSKVIFKKGLK